MDTFGIDCDGTSVLVRTNDAALDGLLREHLRSRMVHPVPDAPVNFSVEAAQEPGRFHRLLWGGCPVVRTLDPARLVHALDRHLAAPYRPPPGAVALDLIVAVGPPGAVILPASAKSRLARLQRQLAERGYHLADVPQAVVDPGTSEVIVRTGDAFDPAAIAAAWARSGRTETIVPAGRYPLARWLVGWPTPLRVPGHSELLVALAADLVDPAARAAVIADLRVLLHADVLEPVPSLDPSSWLAHLST